jgi:hypothetical protein
MTLATLSIAAFLRWLELPWSCALRGVLLGPVLWSFDEEGAGVIAATRARLERGHNVGGPVDRSPRPGWSAATTVATRRARCPARTSL